MTSFYQINYKRQKFDKGEWKDTAYCNQSIIVIAEDYETARSQIISALQNAERDGYRAYPTTKIRKLYALNIVGAYDGGHYVYGMSKEEKKPNLDYEKLVE